MALLNAIIFGLVQGVTEFLPVSSSGHLLVLHRLLSLPIKDDVAFDVALHLATFVAILWFFRKEVIGLAQGFFGSFKDMPKGFNHQSWLIIGATIPAGLAGVLWEDKIESVLRSPLIVALMLVLIGLLFIIVENTGKQLLDDKDISWGKAMAIGCSQVVALIPGTSRSGITTISGMALDLKREAAVRFSFLLSLPIVAGAALKKVPYLISAGLNGQEWLVLAIAFVAAVASGAWAIAFLLRFTAKNSLRAFAYYRFAFASVILLLYLFKILS
ncbi:undecaprenyl-diphosphate phosphatase [Candidatus Falkowbacteria bacterium]|nr:undecaprenyl-diphosphate phosphatase [Candidatus Falkowbacteria bacterium]